MTRASVIAANHGCAYNYFVCLLNANGLFCRTDFEIPFAVKQD